MPLNYQLLEALEAVISSSSFGNASKKLHLTQSAVSQRIALLEDQIGEPLVIRSNPLALTRTGHELVAHFRQVQILEAGLTATRDSSQVASFHRIRIGTNADSLATWFLPAIADIYDNHRVLVEVIAENEELSYQLLERGEVIGCISARKQPISGCEAEFLGKMNYIPAATPSFKKKYFPRGLSLEAIERTPAVIFDRHDKMQFRFLQREFAGRVQDFPHHVIASSHGFIDAILNDLAYGVVPELQARAHLRAKRLVLLTKSAPLSVPLYWHFPRREGSIQRALRQAITAAARRALIS